LRLSLVISLLFTVSACSGGGSSLSSLNPFNLFRGAGNPEQAAARSLAPSRGYGFTIDTRPLVDQITSLKIEKSATGAIIVATALNPQQGYFNAALVAVATQSPGEIILQFRASPPRQQNPVGAVHLREITAGLALSAEQLRNTRRIIVTAARNSRTVRP
jgi:hypothetical protein